MDIEESKESKVCRICLEEEEENGTGDSPRVFISPCNCKGSSKYVHIDCLQSWVKSKKLENNRRHGGHLSPFFAFIYSLSGNEANHIARLTNQPHFRALLSNWYSGRPEGILPGLSNQSNQIVVPLMNLNANLEGSNTNIPEGPSLNDSVLEGTQNSTEQMHIEGPTSHETLIPNTRLIGGIISPLQKNNHGAKPNSTPNVENSVFSNFACDVCKEILPFAVKTGDQSETEVANIPRPENMPYMILEKLSQGKESKVFSVIKGIEDTEIRLVIALFSALHPNTS